MKSDNGALVSCVIACYNRPDYVRHAIDSALAQTYPSLEIVVVDDGSTDETPQVLAAYGDKIKVVRQENAGTAAARNAGIEASRGKYLAWLDSDDAWLPQKIACQMEAATEFPQAVVIFTTCQAIDENSEPPPPSATIPTPPAVIRDDILPMLVVESQVMTPSCLVKREALDAAGWFDAAYLAEDWELNLRLARQGPFAFIDAPLTRVRIHDQRKTTDRWPHALGLLKLRERIEATCAELLAAQPSEPLRQAYRHHRIKYAEAFYRVGRLALLRGDASYARRMLRRAVAINPWVLKYYTRALQAGLPRRPTPKATSCE